MEKINLSIYEWPFKKQIFFYILIFLIGLSMGYYFDISNLLIKRDDLIKTEIDLKQQIEMVINKEIQRKSEISHYNELKGLLSKWNMKFINDDKLPALLDELLAMGAKNQIEFSLFKPENKINSPPYIKVPIKVIAVGNYHQLSNFLSQIANMAYIVSIKVLQFSNENKNELMQKNTDASIKVNNGLTAEIYLEVYMVKNKRENNGKNH